MPARTSEVRARHDRTLRIFIVHGSHHLTDHASNGDGLVAWGFIKELALRGHQIFVATDKLDVRSQIPPNVELVEFPQVRRSKALHYVEYMRKVRAYYRRVAAIAPIDIVHQMNPVVRGISLAMLGISVPVVLGTYVGDWVSLRSAPHYRSLSLPSRITKVGKAAVDALQQHFASAILLATPHALQRVPLSFDVFDRIEYLHHGVDTELYHPEPASSNAASPTKTIVFVGSIGIYKGAATLVEAFAKVVRSEPEARLVLVGGGHDVDLIRARCVELGIAERVCFTGLASRAEVANRLRESSVLCAPSFGEPYGQNVLEAMASGLPVIVTTEGGHRFLNDDEGSIAFEPGNVAQLAKALELLLRDSETARSMGMRNRKLAERRHAWPNVVDRLEFIYGRAITRSADKNR